MRATDEESPARKYVRNYLVREVSCATIDIDTYCAHNSILSIILENVFERKLWEWRLIMKLCTVSVGVLEKHSRLVG